MFEDALRARPEGWRGTGVDASYALLCLSGEERDAIADAIEALRAFVDYWDESREPEEDDEKYHVALEQALAKLDGLEAR